MPMKTPLLAAALAALLCAPAFAQKAPAKPAAKQPSQRELWNAPAEPFHLIDNVYSVGPGGLAQQFLVNKDTAQVLVVARAGIGEGHRPSVLVGEPGQDVTLGLLGCGRGDPLAIALHVGEP